MESRKWWHPLPLPRLANTVRNPLLVQSEGDLLKSYAQRANCNKKFSSVGGVRRSRDVVFILPVF